MILPHTPESLGNWKPPTQAATDTVVTHSQKYATKANLFYQCRFAESLVDNLQSKITHPNEIRKLIHSHKG